MTESALRDWRERIYRTSGETGVPAGVAPAAPSGLRASAGAGHVTLEWEPVDGAIGYLVHRAASAEGPFVTTKQPDVDVPAVPATRYVDTDVTPGRTVHYVVAALGTMETVGEFCAPVAAAAHQDGDRAVTVRVDTGRVTRPLPRPWRPMIGSEHLSHLLSQDETGGRPIGPELTEALRAVHDELGVRAVRAHAILGDDLGVYREVDGVPVHDFTGVDRVYDTLRDIGLRPVVELGYMPRDLAADPSKTVFGYQAIISPPKDYDRWAALVRALTEHLAERYGLEELVEEWSFEVWNEANLEVFWSGTPQEYLRLYDVTAAAVKSVHPGLRVGGPGSAANGWVEELIVHTTASGAALDFVSTHTYGNAPLDWRPVLARHGRAGTPIWWTEWGPTPTHFHGVGDGPFGAAFLLHGMRSAAGRIEALSHWVASDHFEELGRPPRLFHGGFGLLTVGNLRKPRYHALSLAERLGEHELRSDLAGDVAGVEAWAARHDDGRAGVLVWNGTLHQAQADGAAILRRRVTLTLEGLADGPYVVTHHRIERGRSDIRHVWESMGGGDWPSPDQWAELRGRDVLEELHPPTTTPAVDGTLTAVFDLPMPAVSYVEVRPAGDPEGR
ncbi:xylan 1,4-beta-xylosidase [Sphaerisporangium album]|uniref:Xylan 1,4-beta-xylosidase n=1 Tax=Sphaerisporangium album TaxID=509200 RepID=A0A367FBU0_9ACTN|nr:xylan 1,4-beta-xylosidase [Sphaerisporangium album]RCG27050.1 xylan 1,4-beta-xylosidase [Sphaerisporangium album]